MRHRRPPLAGPRAAAALFAALAAAAAFASSSCSFVLDFGNPPGDYSEVYEPVYCVSFAPSPVQLPDDPPSEEHPFGVAFLTAGVINECTVDLAGLQLYVSDLRDGFLVLNADGGPTGEGARVTIPSPLYGANGIFDVGEQISVTFELHRGDADAAIITVIPWGRLPLASETGGGT